MKKRLFRIIMFVLAVFLPLSIFEFLLSFSPSAGSAVNIFDDGPLYRLDTDLIYTFEPNSEASLIMADMTDFKKINSWGLRSPEVSLKKNKKLRIIAAGDSFTEGIGVSRQESYPGY